MAIMTMILIFYKNDGNAWYKRHAGRFSAAAIEFFIGTLMMGVFFWNTGKWFANVEELNWVAIDWHRFLMNFFMIGGQGMLFLGTAATGRACHELREAEEEKPSSLNKGAFYCLNTMISCNFVLQMMLMSFVVPVYYNDYEGITHMYVNRGGVHGLIYQYIFFCCFIGFLTFLFFGISIFFARRQLSCCSIALGFAATFLAMVNAFINLVWWGFWLLHNDYRKKWWLQWEYMIFWALMNVIATPCLPQLLIWSVLRKAPIGGQTNDASALLEERVLTSSVN